ncbi:MAG: DNA-binding transcriptional LysR family regulator [Flavobacteriales bacterium]|jgi:DNA-binding transcriptional LysR family regulator
MNNLKLLPSLVVFAEVAQRSSFTAAAAALSLSKSAVSQHISRLEAALGQQLLIRHTRGMALTPSGTKLLARSELLKDQLNLATQELQSEEAEPSGLFTVTFPNLLEKAVMAPALAQLCKEFPKIRLKILMTDDALDLVEHKIDVSVYGGDLRDSSYRAMPIGHSIEAFYASPSYIQQSGEVECLQGLVERPWLCAPWQKPAMQVVSSVDGRKQTITLKPFALCSSLSTAIALADTSMGCLLLPDFVSNDLLAQGRLQRVLPEFHGRSWPFYFVHAYHQDKPLHIRRFYELLKHYFARAKTL